MSRYARRTDTNQEFIVNALRDIPGVTVEPNHDDILVGWNGNTYWFEIKTDNCVSKRTGEIRESSLKPSQVKLLNNWTGHYAVVWSLDQILREMGL